MEPSVSQLIEPLIKATEAGTIQWAPDPTGGYVSTVGSNTINVYTVKAGVPAEYTIRVLNELGTVVDWTRVEGGKVFEDLDRLYGLARRRATNIDVVLADILHHLETSSETSH